MTEMSTKSRDDSLDKSSYEDVFDFWERDLIQDPVFVNPINEVAVQVTDDESFNNELVELIDTTSKEMLAEEVDQGKGRLRRMLGRAVGHLNYAMVQGYQAPSKVGEFDAKLHDMYAAEEGDGRIRRMRKFMGRNALRISGGVVGGFAATIYGVNLFEKLHGAYDVLTQPTPNINTNSIVDANIPYRTLEIRDYQKLAVVTDIQVGGRMQGDPYSSGYIDSLKQAGMYNESNRNVPVYWSAEMAPISGNMQMTPSDIEGAGRIIDAYNSANGAPVRIFAFSQGTAATSRALQEIAAQNGGRLPDNLTVILEGAPNGDMGIGRNRYANAVDPVLGALGIETDLKIPPGGHVIIRSDVNDIFGASGYQSGARLLEMALGNGHRVIGPDNGILMYTYQKDGVTYEVYGDPQGVNDPLLRIAKENGLPVSPEAEAFMEALIPITPAGAKEPIYANAHDVSTTFGAMVDRAITDNTGMDSEIARKAVDGMMSVPGASHDLQTLLDLERTPDRLALMASDPSTIPVEGPKAANEVNNALNTTIEYLNNPNKFVDLGNAALVANGVQPLIPYLDLNSTPHTSLQEHQDLSSNLQGILNEVQKALPKPKPAPTGSAEVHSSMNVPVKPIPAPVPTPSAEVHTNVNIPVHQLPPMPPIQLPKPEEVIPQIQNFVNQFLPKPQRVR